MVFTRFYKIISVFLVVLLFVPVLWLSASAADYTVYNSSPMSDSYRQLFEDVVINLRDNDEVLEQLGSDDIDYCYFRSGDHEYTLLVCPSGSLVSDAIYPGTLSYSEGSYIQYVFSYASGYNSDYVFTSSVLTDSFAVAVNSGFVYSNVTGIGSNDVKALHQSESVGENVFYILVVTIAFLLLFVAFKFLNKRWLLP